MQTCSFEKCLVFSSDAIMTVSNVWKLLKCPRASVYDPSHTQYYCSEGWIWSSCLFALSLLFEVTSTFLMPVLGDFYISIESNNDRLFFQTLVFATVLVAFLALFKSLRSFFSERFSLYLRIRISSYVHQTYMREFKLDCSLQNFGFFQQLDNVDQRATQDIKDFTDRTSQLFSSILVTPIVIIYYSFYLGFVLGFSAPLICSTYFILGILSSTAVQRIRCNREDDDLVSCVYLQQRKEGEFRHQHSHCVAHLDSILLLQGEDFERQSLQNCFSSLAANSRRLILKLFALNTVVNFFDYFASIANYAVVGGMLLLYHKGGTDNSAALLAQGSFACLYLLSAYSTIVDCAAVFAEASGAARRIVELLDRQTFHLPAPSDSPLETGPEPGVDMTSFHGNGPLGYRPLLDSFAGKEMDSFPSEGSRHFEHVFAKGGRREVLMRVDSLSLRSAAGRVMISCLQLEVVEGMRLLVRGPSGSGKSTLLQVLAGVRPLEDKAVVSGQVTVFCEKNQLVASPQNAYCFHGTLRQNILYPKVASTKSDGHLLQAETDACRAALTAAGLGSEAFLSEEAEKDWLKCCSLGEQQRIAAARLLLRSPSLALLDEPTSGLDEEAEERLFAAFQAACKAFISVGHHSSLRKYHTHELRFKVDGSYSLELI